MGEHTGPAIRLTDQTVTNFLLVEVSVLFEVFVKLVIPRTSTHTVFLLLKNQCVNVSLGNDHYKDIETMITVANYFLF